MTAPRASSGSARRRRHRNLQTRAPAGIKCASSVGLTVISERVVGLDPIALAAPFDAVAQKAHDKYDERQYVANWAEPEYTIAQMEETTQFGLECETASKRHGKDEDGGREPAED